MCKYSLWYFFNEIMPFVSHIFHLPLFLHRTSHRSGVSRTLFLNLPWFFSFLNKTFRTMTLEYKHTIFLFYLVIILVTDIILKVLIYPSQTTFPSVPPQRWIFISHSDFMASLSLLSFNLEESLLSLFLIRNGALVCVCVCLLLYKQITSKTFRMYLLSHIY